MKKPSILIIHNTYFHRGGEDSVVQQEIDVLKKLGYTVFTSFFNNNAYKKFSWHSIFAPARLFFNISAYLRIYRTIKKHKINYAHVHNFSYEASPSVFWAARAAGAITIFTLHNYRLFCLNGLFFRAQKTCMLCHEQGSFAPGIRNKCFKASAPASLLLASAVKAHQLSRTWHNKVDRFVVLNSLTSELLQQTGISAEKIYLRSNFLNQQLEQSLPDYSKRKNFYLFVGRLSEEKGIRHMIDAFSKTGRNLKIIGTGPMEEWLNSLGIKNIEYHPAITRLELLAWYASCKALIFPSIWPEGNPMTLIEAQSAGTPVIAAESSTTASMVGTERGILYTAGSSEALILALNTFEELSTEDTSAMSATIYKHFGSCYREDHFISTLRELYAPR